MEEVIKELLISTACLGIFFTYLLLERFLLGRKLKRIPLRICVTGTRGKSSVARLIGAVLKESGIRTLIKTTGSRASWIDPDGVEHEIRRRGRTTILEEKKIIGLAVKLRAGALICELMGVQPESLTVESTRIFRPLILVITNVRLDHIEQMGNTKGGIAENFASAMPKGCVVFVSETDNYPVFRRTADRLGCDLRPVSKPSRDSRDTKNLGFREELEVNIDLVTAVTRFLGVDEKTTHRGMSLSLPDIGHFKAWEAEGRRPGQRWHFVNGFAANDPHSTRIIMDRLKDGPFLGKKKLIGLLNLRSDRGDRTLQWLEAIRTRMFPEFDRFVLVGKHAEIFERKLKNKVNAVSFLKPDAESLMKQMSEEEPDGAVIFGMGNMKGFGREFTDFWAASGRPHDI